MSDYSYSAPCVTIRLSPELDRELREAVETADKNRQQTAIGEAASAAAVATSGSDYFIQLKGLLAKNQPIPFELLKSYWTDHRHEGPSLVQWMAGSRLVLPSVVVPPRNEALERRCQELRARQKHREYDAMVASIDAQKRTAAREDSRGIWRELRSQQIAVVNTVVTIGGTFAFFYKAVEYSLPERNVPAQVLVAIFACLVVAVAELYFLLRNL